MAARLRPTDVGAFFDRFEEPFNADFSVERHTCPVSRLASPIRRRSSGFCAKRMSAAVSPVTSFCSIKKPSRS